MYYERKYMETNSMGFLEPMLRGRIMKNPIAIRELARLLEQAAEYRRWFDGDIEPVQNGYDYAGMLLDTIN